MADPNTSSPVPNTPGIRKSLRTPDREIALQKAEEMVLEVKVQLKQGGSVLALPVSALSLIGVTLWDGDLRVSGMVSSNDALEVVVKKMKTPLLENLNNREILSII